MGLDPYLIALDPLLHELRKERARCACGGSIGYKWLEDMQSPRAQEWLYFCSSCTTSTAKMRPRTGLPVVVLRGSAVLARSAARVMSHVLNVRECVTGVCMCHTAMASREVDCRQVVYKGKKRESQG